MSVSTIFYMQKCCALMQMLWSFELSFTLTYWEFACREVFSSNHLLNDNQTQSMKTKALYEVSTEFTSYMPMHQFSRQQSVFCRHACLMLPLWNMNIFVFPSYSVWKELRLYCSFWIQWRYSRKKLVSCLLARLLLLFWSSIMIAFRVLLCC